MSVFIIDINASSYVARFYNKLGREKEKRNEKAKNEN